MLLCSSSQSFQYFREIIINFRKESDDKETQNDENTTEKNEINVENENDENYEDDSDLSSENESTSKEAGKTNLKFKGPKTKVNKPCIFCSKIYARKKKIGRYEECSCSKKYGSFDNIKEFATVWNDIEILIKLNECIENNDIIHYHRACKSNYNSKMRSKAKKQTNWHIKRNNHARAFKKLCMFVQEHVVENKVSYYMRFLLEIFLDCLVQEYQNPTINKKLFNVHHIGKKLKKFFSNKINVVKSKTSSKLVVAPAGVKVALIENQLKETDIIQRAAHLIRSKIVNLEKTALGEKITTSDLIRGECKLPDEVLNFYKTDIAGFNYKRKKSDKCRRLAASFTSDLIYTITDGRTRPSKQITLGLALKSLTSSKKLIDLVHAYGHICGYDFLLQLETEATYTLVDNDDICPSNIIRESGLGTAVAYDNFDRFVETPNGRVTLNDTVGIVVQTWKKSTEYLHVEANINQQTSNVSADSREDSPVCTDSESSSSEHSLITTAHKTIKRRKSYKGSVPQIQPYPKKPKVTSLFKPLDDEIRKHVPDSYKKSQQLDTAWVLSHYCGVRTPMWVGFNAKVINDVVNRKKVSYLTPINQSPTDKGVVRETMRRAMEIAKKCNEPYGQAAYDLGIAKIAFPIWSEEQAEFKNLFPHLGGFHTEMALFKLTGTFIKGCGLTTVMVEAQLIGSGSIKNFLSGKIFNRCKRLHILLSLCFQIEEFKMFLETKNVSMTENVALFLTEYQKNPNSTVLTDNEEICSLITQFQKFHEEVLEGLHGKTQQFYATYIQFINYYFIFERSIRTNNFDLYRYILTKINNLFFVFNHHNYCRWMAFYHDHLLKIDETHPGLKDHVMIGVKRTEKPFSCIPFDLTLEETINADAARRMTGVMCLTNSISARMRWSLSHAIRTEIISHVFEESGLKKSNNMTNDLSNRRINLSIEQMKQFRDCLNTRINPFSTQIRKDLLINISTGQAATPQVENFLLNVEKTGEEQKNNLIRLCSENEMNFDKYKFKRNKILNFFNSTKPVKVRSAGKVQEMKLQRDLFGRLLGIAIKQKIDLAKVIIVTFLFQFKHNEFNSTMNL